MLTKVELKDKNREENKTNFTCSHFDLKKTRKYVGLVILNPRLRI